MIEIRCDKCGRVLSVEDRDLPGLGWLTINECHCPDCHPENVNVKEDPEA